MTLTEKAGGRAAAVAVGALAGALIIFGIDGLTSGNNDDGQGNSRTTERGQTSAGPQASETGQVSGSGDEKAGGAGKSGSEEQPAESARVFLAWAPGSLPAGIEEKIEAMPEVRDATTVYAGLDWIESARDANGEIVERHRDGFAVPFEIAAIEPNEYARFVSPDDKEAVRDLGPSGALLAETSVKLRGGGRGLELDLGARTLRATGIVSDLATNGYEALIAGPPPADWVRADRFVLAHLRRPRDRVTVTRKIESFLPAGEPLRTRTEGENPFLRYGDAVLPQLLIKDAFGEFAARPNDDGTITLEPGWAKRNIKVASVPILGPDLPVTCHRSLFPQLREALRDVEQQGLAHLIHPKQFKGCFSARFINSNPGGRLSHHSWGIAVDINAEENRFGAKPNMDPRIVDIFEDRWGFTWGGRWIIPDGMHFEWIKFP